MSNQLPLFEPETTWREPKSLPSIPRNIPIALDTETKDVLLKSRGPGWVFNDNDFYVAGFSLAWKQNNQMRSIYVPVRHPDSQNTPADEAFKWLQHTIDNASCIYFQNRSYDEGALSTEGVTIPCHKADDTHAMAVLLDENRLSYNLDSICRWRGVPCKDETLLREAAAAYGVDPKAELYKLPARHVGPYAEQDSISTYLAAEDMLPEIHAQGVDEAYRLEQDLVPMILAMRRRGIRIDEDEADITMEKLRAQRDTILAELARQLGWRQFTMEHANSPGSLERAFNEQGIIYPKTPKTNKGSFKTDWMSGHEHWLPRLVDDARTLSNMADKFIQTYILDSCFNGRIHAEIHQLRDDDAGTRSFRFSYSNPPLQQIPARDPVMAPLIRGIFLSERDTLWASADYSQQEPRLAVHFAFLCGLPGGKEAVDYYTNDPGADFHDMVAELTGLPRKRAKIINLGLMYGMGLFKLAVSLGVSQDEAKEIIGIYHSRVPFVKALTDFCSNRANHRGYIRLLDGARSHFDMYEPAWRDNDAEYKPPAPLDIAREQWPGVRLRRAFTHKAMNRLIQGSAARQTKLAMRACYQEGILPLIQMHDELGAPIGDAATGKRFSEIMRDVVQLHVPMKVDLQYGWHWGQASQEVEEYKKADLLTFDEVHRNKGRTNKEIFEMRPDPMKAVA